MRYVGQGYEIAVPVPGGTDVPTVAALHERFESAYRQLYGRCIDGLDVEILSWTLNLSRDDRRIESRDTVARRSDASPVRRKTVFDGSMGASVEADCYLRSALSPGDYLVGPALVSETQTTTYVESGFKVCVTEQGHLLLERL